MPVSRLPLHLSAVRTLAIGVLLGASITIGPSSDVVAQDTADAHLIGQMAAITLDQGALPDGYTLVGETFLDADHAGYANIDAQTLTDAGFLGRYVSYYENTDIGGRIISYASAWNSDDAAKAGFALTEDEAKTSPGSQLSDSGTEIGNDPRELTTGTFTEGDTTIGTADLTFTSGSFVVGVDVEKTDGSQPDTSVADSLAQTLVARAKDVSDGKNPAFTDLALAAEAVPLSSLGTGIQVGFLTPIEVERVYGVQGSSLSKLTASWTETVGVGKTAAQVPYITVGLTTFATADDAKAVVAGAGDLFPTLGNLAAVENVSIDGAESVAAYTFTSGATNAGSSDSSRVLVTKGNLLIVVDVQGAANIDLATEAATSLVQAQLGCIGQGTCPAPTLPDGLAG